MLLISLIIIFIYFSNNVYCLSCFKCMTTNFENDTCSDPFHPMNNRLENECFATSNGRNGLFPARFCVKISGIIVDVDRNVNRSLLRKRLYLRTCITDNIMDSTRSSDSTGNFRLKNFNQIKGVRMQGTITLCSHDGCNQAILLTVNSMTILFFLFILLIYQLK
ncbi:unnamed protein product [Rotaria sordida]|uniref:Protein quiver n=1 Tax=Rotaria sordida TaxID=392033 RepID=A0A814P3I6_9BILA|nr:unnamed protein product [Rotaria sordida]CAF3534700.1 unnamed protein product [Rotaria sordida]